MVMKSKLTNSHILLIGIVNVVMTTPLWVVNTRLKLQGATFRTKGLENSKTKKYKGIIGECIFMGTNRAMRLGFFLLTI